MSLFNETLSVVIKTTFAASALFILARLMGKKQISQLSFFDYIVGISIGSVAAAISVEQQISIGDGIVSMVIWALFPIVFSFLSVHSITARRLMDGTPSILIQYGKIVEKNLKSAKFTVNDLLEELRLKDIFNIADVEFAILETNGKLSVLKTSSKQTVTPSDLNLSIKSTGIYANLIIDGKLMPNNLKRMNIDEAWLYNELEKNNIFSVKKVLLATCNPGRSLHIDKKDIELQDLNVFQ